MIDQPEHLGQSEKDQFLSNMFSVLRSIKKGFVEFREIDKEGNIQCKFYNWSTFLYYEVPDGANVYFGIGTRKVQKGDRESVMYLPAIWGQVDTTDDEDKQDQLKYLLELEKRPSIIIDSGHGYHCYWLLKEPYYINSDEEVKTAENIMHGILQCIKGDKTTDIARVGRLPGSINIKDPLNPVRVYVVDSDYNLRYTIEDLQTTFPYIQDKEPESNGFLDDAAINDTMNKIAEYMHSKMQVGQRQELTLALTGYLLKLGWSDQLVMKLMEKIIEDDNEKTMRTEAVKRTSRRWHQGKNIVGKTKLTEILGKEEIEIINEMVMCVESPPLLKKIRDIRKSHKSRDRLEQVSKFVMGELKERGCFYCTASGEKYAKETFYFLESKKIIYQIPSEAFELFLNIQFGLNNSEKETSFILNDIRSFAYELGRQTNIHHFSYFNNKNGAYYFYCGRGRVIKITVENILEVPNGEDGVLFRPIGSQHPSIDEIFDISKNDEYNKLKEQYEDFIQILTEGMKFTRDDANLSITKRQKELILKAFILSLFFPEECPDKPILVIDGPQGSGKTTLFSKLKWILGDWINLAGTVEKIEEIEAACISSRLLVLDNLEKMEQDIENKISSITTGGQIVKRELYTTNQEVVYIPESFFAITCLEPPMTTSPLVDRTIIIDIFKRQIAPTSTAQIKAVIDKQSIFFWRMMFEYIQKIIPFIMTERKTIEFRMASWADFGRRLMLSEGKEKEEEWIKIIESLRTTQFNELLSNSPITDYLIEFFETDIAKRPEGWGMKDIYEWALDKYEKKTPFKSLNSLKRYFTNMRDALITKFNLEMIRSSHGRSVIYKLKDYAHITTDDEELPF